MATKEMPSNEPSTPKIGEHSFYFFKLKHRLGRQKQSNSQFFSYYVWCIRQEGYTRT